MDPGETDYEAALRETKEEAGFSDTVLKVIDDFKVELKYTVTNHRDGEKREKISTYWLAELLRPKENTVLLSDEHQDFKWLSLSEAKNLSGFKDFNEGLDRCHEIIKNKE